MGEPCHRAFRNFAARVTAGPESFDFSSGPPRILVAATVFGRGVPFMENQLVWHYLPMSDEQFALALDAVSEAVA